MECAAGNGNGVSLALVDKEKRPVAVASCDIDAIYGKAMEIAKGKSQQSGSRAFVYLAFYFLCSEQAITRISFRVGIIHVHIVHISISGYSPFPTVKRNLSFADVFDGICSGSEPASIINILVLWMCVLLVLLESGNMA